MSTYEYSGENHLDLKADLDTLFPNITWDVKMTASGVYMLTPSQTLNVGQETTLNTRLGQAQGMKFRAKIV